MAEPPKERVLCRKRVPACRSCLQLTDLADNLPECSRLRHSSTFVQYPEVAVGYLIVWLCGMFIGEVGWLRLGSLSPRRSTRRWCRCVAAALAFGGWYGGLSVGTYLDQGYWRILDWRLLLISIMAAALFMIFSSVPLRWLRRHGWGMLRRQKHGARNIATLNATPNTTPNTTPTVPGE